MSSVPRWFALVLWLQPLVGLAANAPPPPPNLVVILADDLGYGDVGYQGGDVPTPRIDTIAREGAACTDGYVACPVCGPSRAALLTGRYPQRFGYWDNPGPFRRDEAVEPGVPTGVPVLSEMLRPLGYACGFFGKSHGGDAEAMMPFSRWDEFFGFNNGASNYLDSLNRRHNPLFHNREVVSTPFRRRGVSRESLVREGMIVGDEDRYLTDLIGDHAAEFIRANQERPLLCYVPFNAIHGPFQAPESLLGKRRADESRDRWLVRAMIRSMDANVGKLLNTLSECGLEERTLVVFLSDNGGHTASPNTPLRAGKGTFWEGGLRVPFCLRWPGRIPAGSNYRRPVSALDLAPTLLAAAGGQATGERPPDFDGVDLLPYLTGERQGDPHDALHWAWGPNRAIRRGDLKAVSFNRGSDWSLYDVAEDAAEQIDLASERPDDLAALIEQHDAWSAPLPPPAWGWNPKIGRRDERFGKPRPYHRAP